MRRRDFVWGAAAALVPRKVGAQSAGLEKIRLVTIPHDSLTPIYYGLAHGQFARAGIDLEMNSVSSGAVATTATIAGTYDIGNSSLVATMEAHMRGIPIAIVAPMSTYTPKNPASALQIAADSQLKTGSDLNGKTIAVSAVHDLGSLSIKAWTDKNGGDAKSLKFLEIPNSATEQALVEHRVDAGLMNEPLLDISINAGETKTLGDCMGAIAPTFMYAGLIARREWADAHADLVRRFARTLTSLSAYTNLHPAETVAMMAAITKVSVPVMQKVRRVICATSLDARLVQPFIDAAAKYGEIAQPFPAKDIFWT